MFSLEIGVFRVNLRTMLVAVKIVFIVLNFRFSSIYFFKVVHLCLKRCTGFIVKMYRFYTKDICLLLYLYLQTTFLNSKTFFYGSTIQNDS